MLDLVGANFSLIQQPHNCQRSLTQDIFSLIENPNQGWAFSGFDTHNPNPNPIFDEKSPQIGGEP